MSVETDSGVSCAFAGDWTTGGVSGQLPMLMQKLAEFRQSQPRPAALDLDLSGVTDLDACGCQLLAAFVRTLGAEGVVAGCCGLSLAYRDKLRLLGFDAELHVTAGELS